MIVTSLKEPTSFLTFCSVKFGRLQLSPVTNCQGAVRNFSLSFHSLISVTNCSTPKFKKMPQITAQFQKAENPGPPPLRMKTNSQGGAVSLMWQGRRVPCVTASLSSVVFRTISVCINVHHCIQVVYVALKAGGLLVSQHHWVLLYLELLLCINVHHLTKCIIASEQFMWL